MSDPENIPNGSTAEYPGLAGKMAALGALTLSLQILLLREVFSSLYGSEIAIAYALATWTLAAGLGALLVGARGFSGFRAGIGRIALPILTAGLFLGVRAWGAREVLSLKDYLYLPFFVSPPAFLGGALFSWQLAECGKYATAAAPAAYAWETTGGITAGLLVALYAYIGGAGFPVIILLVPFAMLVPFVVRGRAWRQQLGAGLLFLLALALAGAGVFDRLALSTLRLRYPGYKVVAHATTPFAALTAVERGNTRFVFENGLPTPPPTVTRSKLAVTAFLAQFPRRWRRAIFLRAVSAGYADAVRYYRAVDSLVWEPDARKVHFLAKWLGARTPEALYTAPSPWQCGKVESMDLIAVFAALPGAFSENRCLTLEFFRDASERLAPGGVLAVLLPAAPGYIHPRLNRVFRAVRAALDAVFPWTAEYRTDLGAVVFVGGKSPIPTQFNPDRFASRMLANADSGIAGEVSEIFWDAGLAKTLGRAMISPAETRPNSMVFPVACFAYLKFRGAMIETAAGFWDRFLRPMPRAGAFLAIVFFLLALKLERKVRSAGRLFWASWLTTMTLVTGLYLAQGIIGQAYWLMALLSAASLLGVFLAAASNRLSWNAGPAAALYAVFLPALFLGWRAFDALPAPLFILALFGGNIAMGLRTGALFRHAAELNRDKRTAGAVLFGVDLLGAACGFLLGGVLLVWWTGFSRAGVLCASCAMLLELKKQR